MKILLSTISYFVLGVTVLVLLYFVIAILLGRMAVKAEPAQARDVTIYILHNGAHTDLVLPVKNNVIDWSDYVKYKHTIANDTTAPYLGFGWGDKGFYLETPTWADLKVSTAFKAVTGLGASAIHATFIHEVQEKENCKAIYLSNAQYKRLVQHITKWFELDSEGKPDHIKTNANYGNHDAFYEAKGSYNLTYTCNTWTNESLKAAGQKACVWTPFYQGIFYQYR